VNEPSLATTPDGAAAPSVGPDIAGPVRIGVVLSAGGLRGVAHLGVMRRLLEIGVPIDVLVGVSAGAVVAGYYAAAGLTIEDMIADAPVFKGRHLVMHGLSVRAPQFLKPMMRSFCGVIPTRLAQLETARFDCLHHGVRSLGIVCHDLIAGRPMYFSTSAHHGAPLAAVVKSSAAVPRLMPTRPVTRNGRTVHLVDGGVSDSLPCAFAREVLGATHLIVSDCRRIATAPSSDPRMVYIRPELNGAAPLRSPSGSLLVSVARGEEACTPDLLATIRGWTERASQDACRRPLGHSVPPGVAARSGLEVLPPERGGGIVVAADDPQALP
jgi:predicted acylesterase/phospholipase RssA